MWRGRNCRRCSRIKQHDPELLLKVRVEDAASVRQAFERGDLNVAILRQGARRDGDLLFVDPYGWFASPDARFGDGPIPLITAAEVRGVGALVRRLLVRNKVRWAEAL